MPSSNNGAAVWYGSATADQEGEFSHDFTREVMPDDRISFDIVSDTTLEPAQVEWHPEVVYETYCVEIPDTDPKQYSCGPVVCKPDQQGVVQCGVDIPELPPAAQIKEEDLHQYGQPNYPLLYLTPTDLARFWVAPYDGKVRGYSLGRYDLGPAAAPLVFIAAEAGDAIARSLIRWAGSELGEMVNAVARQLDFQNLDFEVIMIGSVPEWTGSDAAHA